jgi:hypothetical protein
MITLDLTDAVEDLRAMGVPEEHIQRWYDRHKNKTTGGDNL